MATEEILMLYKKKFCKDFFLLPILGCELEFYSSVPCPKLLETDLDIVEECGHNQYELRIVPTDDIMGLTEQIKRSKKEIIKIVEKYGGLVLFGAKPFADRPCSTLQIHLNFLSLNKKSASPMLQYAIGGLLHTMPDFMVFFAPKAKSYELYTQKTMTTPTTISWGYNNRTTALRVIKGHGKIERVEHRIAGADADLLEVMKAILFGAYIGIREKIPPPPPTYGLAFDPQYGLASLPLTLIEAKKNFTNSKFSDMFDCTLN